MADGDDDNSWIVELETALLQGHDSGSVQGLTKGRIVPDSLRADLWQVYLGVKGIKNPAPLFDEIFDLPEQTVLREDCQQLVDRLGNEEEDKVSVLSDVESVVTCYCKTHKLKYEKNNGWMEILAPLIALKLPRSELYNCFDAITTKYIPRTCYKNSQLFHLFRLLILYHDPELCSFLDTKKITPDTYAVSWFRSLFSSVCDLKVIQNIWDVYLQLNDPFLVFFLALVILVNSKDQLMSFVNDTRQSIIEMLTLMPTALEADDIEDFCSLARFYATRTPQSFRKDYHNAFFGSSNNVEEPQISHALCLPVSVQELIQNSQLESEKGNNVRYFVVDCRPAEQYNSGHLPTAFHLDASLMLLEPQAFNTAVQALFTAQQQALAADSIAAGEHLCFMGSGREEEDQYVHMVVASFLQKHCLYISLARGGYRALHDLLQDNLSKQLTDHNSRGCVMCNPEANSQMSDSLESEDFFQKNSVLSRLSSAFKSKTAEVTGKLVDYIQNPHANQPIERHVSSNDKRGRMYRNMAPVFSIDDEHDGEEGGKQSAEEEIQDIVSLATWLKKPEITGHFKCHQVNENGMMYASCLVITDTHLYILHEMSDKKGFAYVSARRALSSIVKITSKRRHPELITFKYGTLSGDNFLITDLDRFLIPEAPEATKLVKQQIVKHLETS